MYPEPWNYSSFYLLSFRNHLEISNLWWCILSVLMDHKQILYLTIFWIFRVELITTRLCPRQLLSELPPSSTPGESSEEQSQKKTASASAMLTGKFLQQAHYWLKNFRIFWKMSGYYTKYPDNMQSVRRMNWKVSGWSKKCWDELESFQIMQKVSG